MCPNSNIVCIWAGAIAQLVLVHMKLTLSLDSHASKPHQVGDNTITCIYPCHSFIIYYDDISSIYSYYVRNTCQCDLLVNVSIIITYVKSFIYFSWENLFLALRCRMAS